VIKHAYSNAVADGTATTVVRPSDWNSAHVQQVSISGNTVGVSSFTARDVVFQGGNNLTLSASVAGAVATMLFSAADAAALTHTHSQYLTTAAQSDHIHSQYLTTAQPVGAYLTTAAQSDHSHGAVAFTGTNVSGSFTSASNGLSIQLSAGAGGGGGAGLSAGTQSVSTGTVAFANSNGITFGMSGSNQITASHNGLTTAAQSNHSHNLATTTTNGSQIVVATTNSAGATIAVPAFLTTAQAPGAYLTTAALSADSSKYAGTTSGFTGGASISGSMTHNTAGLAISLSHPAWLTTAAQSSASNVSGVIAGTNATGGTATLSGNVSFGNANGVSFYTSAGNAVVASVKTDYLTTAMASNAGSNFVGLNSGLTGNGVSATINSSGISLNVPAFLTTAAQSGHSHGMVTTTTNGSLVTVAGNSGGYTLAVPPFVTAAAGGGDGYNILGVNGAGTSLSATLQLSNANNVSFGLNAGTITASASYVNDLTSGRAGTGYTSTTQAGSTVGATNNTAGLSMAWPPFLTTAQPAGAYLTTARASNDAIGLNSGLTANGVSMTANSSGLSLNFPAFLTTAALSADSSKYAGTGSGFTGGASISATLTHNTQGLSISLSHPAWLTTAALSGDTTKYAGLGTTFAGANVSGSMTHNTAGLNLSLSVAAPGAAAENNWFTLGGNVAGASTASGSTIQLYGGDNITLSGGGNSAISIVGAAGGGGAAVSSLVGNNMIPGGSTGSQTFGAMGVSTASAIYFPVSVSQTVHFNQVNLPVNLSYVSSSVSGRQTITSNFGIFSNNAGTLSRISSGSFSMDFTNSSASGTLNCPTSTGTAGYGYGTVSHSATAQAQSLYGTVNPRLVGLQFGGNMTLTPGMYWIGIHARQSSSSANVGISYGLHGVPVPSINNIAPIGIMTTASTTNFTMRLPFAGFGYYTWTGSAGYSGTNLPASAFLSGIAHSASVLPGCTFVSV
jgi:hypothetical protein